MTRLTEIDALRGVAACSVMAFHYTTKYDELYRFNASLPFAFPWGYLGFNLFFVISGFVIFMSLQRTGRGVDFVVSRASRLFPAYWIAILITFSVTHWLGLPGKEVPWHIAVMNFPMFHQFFSIPSVDDVYWTLLVELFFYALAFMLFVTGSLARVLMALWALLALRLVYCVVSRFLGIDLPWRISQVLILEFIPWFALGIVAYRIVHNPDRLPRNDLLTAAMAITVLAFCDSLMLAGFGVVCFAVVWAAASGRIALLRLRGLVWLGSISYPLYLLHENIGWSVLRQLQLNGWSPVPAIAITTVLAVVLAAIVSYSVERPAMAWIRQRYKQARRASPGTI